MVELVSAPIAERQIEQSMGNATREKLVQQSVLAPQPQLNLVPERDQAVERRQLLTDPCNLLRVVDIQVGHDIDEVVVVNILLNVSENPGTFSRRLVEEGTSYDNVHLKGRRTIREGLT